MIEVVSTADWPDLVPITGRWRWEAFLQDHLALEEVLQGEQEAATNGHLMPTVLVLLERGEPVGMAALCLDDLEGRPDLNPWLAGVYVADAHRGKGHAMRLINAVEELARRAGIGQLFLYTSGAQGLYDKAGWSHREDVALDGQAYAVMQKRLLPE